MKFSSNLIILFLLLQFLKIASSENLNLYSARQEVLMRDLINSFEKKTNIKVNIISAKANQLMEKIEMEGRYTKADILLTVDVSRLLEAKKKNLFKAVESNILKEKDKTKILQPINPDQSRSWKQRFNYLEKQNKLLNDKKNFIYQQKWGSVG